jgi:Tol biopolymer transport system component
MCVAILLATVMAGSVLADWTTPVPVESGINTQYNDCTPFLSYDGLSLYFSRYYSSSSKARIFEAKRSQPSGPFTSVSEALSSTSGHVMTPWVSPDNLRMYYHEESSAWMIKMSQRSLVNDPWSQGTSVSGLPSGISSPSLSEDELTIVFNNPSVGNYDIYMATRPDRTSPFGNIRGLDEINTAANESRPFLSPDALTIYYNDIILGCTYQAMRESLNDPFSDVQRLTFLDMPGRYSVHPAISSDGTTIYFNSGLWGMNGDIYVSYLVPEPATLLLLGIGGVLLRRSKR